MNNSSIKHRFYLFLAGSSTASLSNSVGVFCCFVLHCKFYKNIGADLYIGLSKAAAAVTAKIAATVVVVVVVVVVVIIKMQMSNWHLPCCLQ